MPGRVYVLGHRNPDTDSIVAAIAYGELLRHERDDEIVPGRVGELRKETAYLLDRFGLEAPALMTNIRQRVGDVMTSPASTVLERDSLYEVGRRQQEMEMRPLPVVDEQGRLCGILEARDFAKVFFEGLDPDLADEIPIEVDNVVKALDARVLHAAPERRVRDKVMVAAWSVETIRERIEPDVVLVVGDRLDVQRAAMEIGVGMLIVTGGNPVGDDVVRLAKERNTTVLAVEHHTAATLRLIQMSVPVSYIMRRDPPRVEPDDPLDEAREALAGERAVAVVDERRRVVGVVSRADLLRGARRRVALVDHNERAQAVEGIDEAEIVALVDHHRIADVQTTQPPFVRIEPVGACSTVVAKLFAERGIEPPPPLAGAMLGAILADTLLFKSPTTTDDDRRAAARLAKIAKVDAGELGQELLAIASDVSDRTAEQLVTGDFKSFDVDGDRYGVGVIETGNARGLRARRDELVAAMRELRDEGYDLVMLVVTDVVHDKTIVLTESHAEPIARALGGQVGEDATIALEGVYSRKKQIVPQLGRIKEAIALSADTPTRAPRARARR